MGPRRTFLVAILVFSAGGLSAASDPRTGGNTLREFADAQVTAVAGAACALTGDLGVGAVNPAALATLRGAHLSTQFQSSLGDARTGLLSYGRSGTVAGWSVSAVLLDAGSIEIVPLSGPTTVRNAQRDMAFSLAGGWAVTRDLRFGAAVKTLNSTLVEEYHAAATAGDVGAQWDLSEKLTLGLSALNLGGKVTYRTVGDPLPTEYRAGLAYRFSAGEDNAMDFNRPRYAPSGGKKSFITLSGDAATDRFGSFSGALGLEWDYGHRAVFRLGGRGGDAGDGFTAGVGFWMRTFRLDYSYQGVGELPDRHRVTLSWFGTRRTPD